MSDEPPLHSDNAYSPLTIAVLGEALIDFIVGEDRPTKGRPILSGAPIFSTGYVVTEQSQKRPLDRPLAG